MKHLGLICNTMILMPFILRSFHKLRACKKPMLSSHKLHPCKKPMLSSNSLPRYAIILPGTQDIVVGYAETEESAKSMRKTMDRWYLSIVLLETMLEDKVSTLDDRSIISVTDLNAIYRSALYDIVQWSRYYNFNPIVLKQIAKFMQSKRNLLATSGE